MGYWPTTLSGVFENTRLTLCGMVLLALLAQKLHAALHVCHEQIRHIHGEPSAYHDTHDNDIRYLRR